MEIKNTRKNCIPLFFLLAFIISIPNCLAFDEIWRQVASTDSNSIRDNYFGGTATISAIINGTHINDSATSIILNISCNQGTYSADSETITATFCQRDKNDYGHECINSTRVNITNTSLHRPFSCPYQSYVLTAPITITFNNANDYIYFRYVGANEDYIRYYSSDDGKTRGGHIEGSDFTQVNSGGTAWGSEYQINDLWSILQGSVPDTTPPEVTYYGINLTYNDTYNYDFFFNASLNEAGNCTANNTAFNLITENNTLMQFSETTLTDGFYSVLVNCTDLVNNSNATILHFTKDTESPQIYSYFPLEDNSSIIENTGTFTLIMNLSDNIDLYTFEINLSYVDILTGKTYLYNDSINLTGTKHLYSEVVNSAGYPNASVLVETRICDSHTKSLLTQDATIIKNIANNELNYQVGNNLIKIVALEPVTDILYNKLEDRYTFSFKYSESKNIAEFYIYSTDPIIYRSNTPFSAHFVTGYNWVDFEPYKNAIIEPLIDEGGKVYYKVSIAHKTDLFTFNSIGELNCINKNYVFEIGAVEEDAINIFNIDLSQTSQVILLFILAFLYIGLNAIGYFFKNFGFVSMAFFIGFFMGMMLLDLHWVLTAIFFLLNIVVLVNFVRTSK